MSEPEKGGPTALLGLIAPSTIRKRNETMKRRIGLLTSAVLLVCLYAVSASAQLFPAPRTCQISASASAKTACDVYEVDATSGAVTITLVAPARRDAVAVFKLDSSGNAVTVATAGTGATINGSSTYTISNQYEGAIFVANGRGGSDGAWRAFAKQSATGSDISITSQARGDIIRRNASSWGRLSAKTSGAMLIGDGTDVISAAMSGDGTLSAAGAMTIATSAVTTGKILDGTILSADLDETLIHYATVSISSAAVTGTSAGQLGHANGYELVAAPGTHKAIEFISAVVINDFATAAYTDGGNVSVNHVGGAAVSGVVSAANSIGAGADKIAIVFPAVPSNNQLLENTALNLVAASAFTQPGTAAGVVRVKVAYRVHTTGL
jgi:hypothetical protein